MIVIDSTENPEKVYEAVIGYSYASFIATLDNTDTYLKKSLFDKYRGYCHQYRLPVGGKKGFTLACEQNKIHFMKSW